MGRIYLSGTADTKGQELAFLKGRIEATGASVTLVDVGIRPPTIAVDVAAPAVAACDPQRRDVLALTNRGEAVAAMGIAFAAFIAARADVAGIVGVGGGGGTSIVTAGMRVLPIGLPKLMVSTLASGDVAPYVGVSDIVMMPSVTDIAGLNRISRVVLANAAAAIAGMVRAPAESMADDKPSIGLSMFGVTTPCVTQAVDALRADYDCMVFHATGTGGRAMEKLADDGFLVGFVDATTTEVCDLLLGGVLSAGPDRFGAPSRTRLPWVGSVGACDMVNFWAMETVPERYRARNLHVHNPNVTLMRTTPQECRAIGGWIAERLNRCDGPVRFLLPEGGVSALDAPGQPFHDPVADAALFEAIEATFQRTAARRLERLPCHINDPAFSAALVARFREIEPQGNRHAAH